MKTNPIIITLSIKNYSDWKLPDSIPIEKLEFYTKFLSEFDPLVIPWGKYRLVIYEREDKLEPYIEKKSWNHFLLKKEE